MKFDLRIGRHRYWATLHYRQDGRPFLRFWSNHKWPFYHGAYMPCVLEREDAWRAFMEWIPTKKPGPRARGTGP